VVLAGIPPVVAALGVGGHPVGRDERAVQADERQPGGVGPGEHVGQVGGVFGGNVERFVQIAVGGGDAQPGLDGQRAQIQSMPQPAQHEHDLDVHRAGSLRRPRPWAVTMPGDPPGHRLEHRCGHVPAGTATGRMGHGGLPGKTGIGFGETIFAPRARAFPLNSDRHQRRRQSGRYSW
jgi:hypothetical protein